MKLYMFRTVHLSIIRSLLTVHSAMVYVIQVCTQLSSRSICSCSKAASNEIFSPSNKIHRKVGHAKDLSATLYVSTSLIACPWMSQPEDRAFVVADWLQDARFRQVSTHILCENKQNILITATEFQNVWHVWKNEHDTLTYSGKGHSVTTIFLSFLVVTLISLLIVGVEVIIEPYHTQQYT
jgi:hypothetical protein